MKRLERSALVADREAIASLLADLPEDDLLGRMSFESRLSDIEEQLEHLEERMDTVGSVALMFGGDPVSGSRAIDSDFATTALKNFHALVKKRVALDTLGSLGDRGPVPTQVSADLAITELVRGSIGFLLEESVTNEEIADTPVKSAMAQVTDLVAKTASEDAADFEQAVESLDHRLLVSLRDFFRTLETSRATVSIVEEAREARLDFPAIQRGWERVETTEIEESESESIVGELLGLLPESRRFEMRLRGTDDVIKGTVLAAFSARYLELIEDPNESPVGRHWRAKMKIREVTERNRPPRKLYSLIGLLEQVEPDNPKQIDSD